MKKNFLSRTLFFYIRLIGSVHLYLFHKYISLVCIFLASFLIYSYSDRKTKYYEENFLSSSFCFCGLLNEKNISFLFCVSRTWYIWNPNNKCELFFWVVNNNNKLQQASQLDLMGWKEVGFHSTYSNCVLVFDGRKLQIWRFM